MGVCEECDWGRVCGGGEGGRAGQAGKTGTTGETGFGKEAKEILGKVSLQSLLATLFLELFSNLGK